MSSLTQVYVTVDRAGAIRRGINGTETPVLVDLDVSQMAPQQRDQIAARYAQSATTMRGDPVPHYPRLRGQAESGGYYESPIEVDEPTQEGVLRAIAAEEEAIATYAARQSAKQEAARQKARDAMRHEIEREPERQPRTVYAVLGHDWQPRRWTHWRAPEPDGYDSDKWVAASEAIYVREYLCPKSCDDDQLNDALAKRRDTLDQESAAREAEALESAKQQLLPARQERLDWVAAHGSPRLVGMAAEGIVCERTYQAERAKYESENFVAALAEARPGWIVVEECEIDRAIHDVSDRALTILAAGRQVASSCKLARYEGRYVCVDTFRGRLIVWPQD